MSRLISFRTQESLEVFLFITWTTAILSECKITVQFLRLDPHISKARGCMCDIGHIQSLAIEVI